MLGTSKEKNKAQYMNLMEGAEIRFSECGWIHLLS